MDTCQTCKVVNGSYGARDKKNKWWDISDIESMNSTDGYYRFGYMPNLVTIQLNQRSNLCQKCHRKHVAEQKATINKMQLSFGLITEG